MRSHKFNAKPKTVDGIRFASQAEARRYGELKLLAKAGKIAHLSIQPTFPLYVWDCDTQRDVQIGKYIADFQYWDGEQTVIEDVKSPATRTAVYKLKKKIVEHRLGITITEITR